MRDIKSLQLSTKRGISLTPHCCGNSFAFVSISVFMLSIRPLSDALFSSLDLVFLSSSVISLVYVIYDNCVETKEGCVSSVFQFGCGAQRLPACLSAHLRNHKWATKVYTFSRSLTDFNHSHTNPHAAILAPLFWGYLSRKINSRCQITPAPSLYSSGSFFLFLYLAPFLCLFLSPLSLPPSFFLCLSLSFLVLLSLPMSLSFPLSLRLSNLSVFLYFCLFLSISSPSLSACVSKSLTRCHYFRSASFSMICIFLVSSSFLILFRSPTPYFIHFPLIILLPFSSCHFRFYSSFPPLTTRQSGSTRPSSIIFSVL